MDDVQATINPEHLWNCCEDNERPEDFDHFEGLEVAPVIQEDGYCEQVCWSPSEEELEDIFWSVYGRIPRAGAECLGDFATMYDAIIAARQMGRTHSGAAVLDIEIRGVEIAKRQQL